MNRRQRIAFTAFYVLNRDRDYINDGMGLKPLNIKTRIIKEYWREVHEPIDVSAFLILVRTLDDQFITFSLEQAQNGRA